MYSSLFLWRCFVHMIVCAFFFLSHFSACLYSTLLHCCRNLNFYLCEKDSTHACQRRRVAQICVHQRKVWETKGGITTLIVRIWKKEGRILLCCAANALRCAQSVNAVNAHVVVNVGGHVNFLDSNYIHELAWIILFSLFLAFV